MLARHPMTVCTGVSWWNEAAVRALLAGEDPQPGHHIRFLAEFADGLALARKSGAELVGWASKVPPEGAADCRAAGVPLTFLEDGFLRSVGLGAGLARGGCYVLDRRGIYYDATSASDLEHLIETAEVDAAERARAAALIEAIRVARLSKYNVGGQAPRLAAPAGREKVLVVGQVAVDAGVRRTLSATIDVAGSANVNVDLLKVARDAFPKAHIVYKPHPDVAADLRPGFIAPDVVRRYADETIADADIIALIACCDRIVTVSSLSGFEALLRGRPVTVHGMPFYAGWGLTDDATACRRRTRRRTLEEVAAIALLRYCRYVDPVSLVPVSAEEMIERLANQRRSRLHRLRANAWRKASWLGRRLGL